MSEQTPPTPENKPPGKSAAARKPGKWPRRMRRTVIVLLALFVLFRLSLTFLLPPALRRAAAIYNLNITYERIDLDLLGGDFGIWHVALTPFEGKDPIIAAEYCRADISTLDLLRGRLVIQRIDADGVDATIERTPNGEIPLLKRFLTAHSSPAAVKTPAPETTATTRPIDLTSPLQMDSVSMRLRMHIHDEAVTPEFQTVMMVNLRLTDLRSQIRPTRFSMDVSSLPVLDSLQIDGKGSSSGQSLDASLTVNLRGYHPRQAAAYLAPLGLSPTADYVSAGLTANLKAEPIPGDWQPKWSLDLSNISLSADGQTAAQVDSIKLSATSVSDTAAHIASFIIDGVHASAQRTSDGHLAFAGMNLVPVPPGTVAGATQPAVIASAPPTTQPAFQCQLDYFAITNASAQFSDSAVTPANQLSVALPNLTIKNVVIDPANPNASASLTATVFAPGIFHALQLDGKFQPFAARKTGNITLSIDGIRPDALKPYLDQLGLESTYQSGTLACSLNGNLSTNSAGNWSIDGQLASVRLADGSQLLAMDDVQLSGLSVTPAGLIHVGDVKVAGPAFDASRDSSGALCALGFRTKPLPLQTARAPSDQPATASPPASPFVLPDLQIDHFIWQDVHIGFDDQGVAPETRVALRDAGIEIKNLRLRSQPNAPPVDPATLRAWLKAPGLAGDIELTGAVTPRVDGPAVDLALTGSGLNADLLAPYLKPLGIEPLMKNGAFHLHFKADVEQKNNALSAGLSLSDVVLQDDQDQLAAVKNVSITGIDVHPGTIGVEDIAVDQPTIHVTRDPRGALSAAGFRQLLQAGEPAPEPTIGLTPPVSAPSAATRPALALGLKKLTVTQAKLRWTDQTFVTPVDLDASVDSTMDDFSFGSAKDHPASFNVTLAADHAIDKLTIAGNFTPSLTSPSAHVAIDGTGITGTSMAAYLPAGQRLALKDGRFHTVIDASIAPNPQGGSSANAVIGGLDFRDGASGPVLFHFDKMNLAASRVDPTKVIAIDELSLSGLQSEIHHTPAGLSAMGLTFGDPDKLPGAQRVPPPASATTQAAVAPAVIITGAAAGAGGVTQTSATDVAVLVGRQRKKYPLVTVDKLDLGIDRFRFVDDMRPLAKPTVISNLHVRNPNRLEMLGGDPDSHAPVELQITWDSKPLVEQFTIDTKLWPFARDPGGSFDLNATGINGEALLGEIPELRSQIDASQLTSGQFHVDGTLHLKFNRTDPLDFDLSKPFDADLDVRNVRFVAEANGPILAGVDEVHSDSIKVNPQSDSVHIHTLEITQPRGLIVRDADGLHMLGLSIKAGAHKLASTEPSAAPASEPVDSSPEPAPQNTPVAAEPQKRPTGEITIDKLFISGVDLRYEDRAVEPNLIVPINALDVDARNLTTLAPYQDKPFDFNATVNAGKVRIVNPNGSADNRDLFSQITASGNISLFPQPHGWIKMSISGFELYSISGVAKQFNETLGGGTFDDTTDIRLQGTENANIQTKLVFTDLKLSEPPNGFIQRTFKLPAPLDALIFAIQGADGAITIPLNIPIENRNLSVGGVTASAVEAMTGVFANAIVNAPLKAANLATSLMGVSILAKKQPATEPPFVLEYGAGETSPGSLQLARLQPLIDRMKTDKSLELTIRHELAPADVSQVEVRANPTADDARSLASQLRDRKMQLLKDQARLLGLSRAQLQSGTGDPVELAQLRDVEVDLAQTEDALDKFYDLQRPGADRQATRRTRAASIELGDLRVDEIRRLFVAAGIPDVDRRVHVNRVQSAVTDLPGGGRVIIVATRVAK